MSEQFHSVTLTFDHNGMTTKFECSAPEGADCRMACAEKCSDWPCEHDLADYGTCIALEWFENDGGVETFRGEKIVYSGPIEPAWDESGFYQWSIPGPGETVVSEQDRFLGENDDG